VGTYSKSFLPFVIFDLAWGLVLAICCLRRIFWRYRPESDLYKPFFEWIELFSAIPDQLLVLGSYHNEIALHKGRLWLREKTSTSYRDVR
jgi:hypothetical protein